MCQGLDTLVLYFMLCQMKGNCQSKTFYMEFPFLQISVILLRAAVLLWLIQEHKYYVLSKSEVQNVDIQEFFCLMNQKEKLVWATCFVVKVSVSQNRLQTILFQLDTQILGSP